MGILRSFVLQDEHIFSDLTVEDLYNPRFNEAYSMATTATFGMATVTYLVAAYVVLTKSTPAMGDYKYLLLAQLSWSYLFELVIFLWKPVVLWPLKLAYSVGLIDFGHDTVPIMFPTALVVIYGMGVSLAVCLFYRISKVFVDSFLDIFFGNKLRIFVTYWTIFLVAAGYPAILVAFEKPDHDQLRTAIIDCVPATQYFFDNYPSTGGYSSKLAGIPFVIFVVSCVVIAAGIIVAFTLIHFLVQRQLARYARCLSTTTLRMQRMLYQALWVQIVAIVVFLYCPLVMFIVTLFLRLRNGSQYALIAITVTTLHMTVDALVLLYFVRPYREYVVNLLTCGRAGKRKSSVISLTSVASLRTA